VSATAERTYPYEMITTSYRTYIVRPRGGHRVYEDTNRKRAEGVLAALCDGVVVPA
jgi:hypothetical protein